MIPGGFITVIPTEKVYVYLTRVTVMSDNFCYVLNLAIEVSESIVELTAYFRNFLIKIIYLYLHDYKITFFFYL